MGQTSDRVTNKQLYEELTKLREELPTRRELRLTVAAAVVSVNVMTAVVLKYTGATPALQATAVHVLHHLI